MVGASLNLWFPMCLAENFDPVCFYLYSVLPEDDWFVDVSQEAIYRLNGKSILFDGHQYPRSPTTSISAYSMLSI